IPISSHLRVCPNGHSSFPTRRSSDLAIPGVGTSGGFTFVLEDRAGNDLQFLASNLNSFLAALRKRPEIASVNTTFLGSEEGIERSEEHTSELQSRGHLVCRLLLEKKN